MKQQCLVAFIAALTSVSGMKISLQSVEYSEQEFFANLTSSPQIQYIGDLDDTKKHPYVYETRGAANSACKSAGFQGLCTKAQVDGFQRCAAGWMWDFKGYWMSKTRKGCGKGKGFRTWGNGKVGAYCCNPKSEVAYIGSLTDPSAHPYVYTSRADAGSACQKAGYKGLCAKKQLKGFSKCAAGWTSDWKGYWFHKTKKGCGSGIGFRNWKNSKVGAYCCGSVGTSSPKYIGSLTDTSAHPYVYETRAKAVEGCKSAGFKRLCYQSEIAGASKCAAGWFQDFKGYWFHETAKGCGSGKGFRKWGAGKVGAYCCQPDKPESTLPLCKGGRLQKVVGTDHWQCDTFSGKVGTDKETQCAESYDTDSLAQSHMQCGVHAMDNENFNCLASELCRVL